MAKAIFNLEKSTLSNAIVRRAKALVPGLPTDSGGGLNFLGTTTADQAAELVVILNDCQRRLLNRFPLLNTTTAAFEATADTRQTALPTTMRLQDIIDIYWDEEGDCRDRHLIKVISYAEVRKLPEYFRQSDFSEDFPRYLSIDPYLTSDTPKASWYGLPSSDKSAVIIFRAKETPFTVADIETPAIISAIPDDMITCYTLHIATEFAERNFGIESATAAAMRMKRDASTLEWQKILSAPRVTNLDNLLERDGEPKLVADSRTFDFGMHDIIY